MMEDNAEKTYAGMSRRAFSLGACGAVALFAIGELKALPAEAQVRPPGGQDEDHLVSACIRCERCIEACPRKALTPAHIEDGILDARMPVANFDVGWCDFCAESNNGNPAVWRCAPPRRCASKMAHRLKLPFWAKRALFKTGVCHTAVTTAAGFAMTHAPTKPSRSTTTIVP